MYTRSAITLLLILWVGAPAAAEPLQDLKLDLDRLQSWGTKAYEYSTYRTKRTRRRGVQITELRLKPRDHLLFTTIVLPNGVQLRDQYRDAEPGSRRGLMISDCKENNYLELVGVRLRIRDARAVGTVADGKLTLRSGDAVVVKPFPPATLTLSSFMRVVTLLPSTAGASYEVGNFAPTPALDAHSAEETPIRCVGPAEVLIEGKPTKTTKFEFAGLDAYVRVADNVLVRIERYGVWRLELGGRSLCRPPAPVEPKVEVSPADLDPPGGGETPPPGGAKGPPRSEDPSPF